MNLRPGRWNRVWIVTVAVAISATILAPAAVSQSADDLRARAQEIDAQLSAAESREIALGEQMNAAAERLAEAQAAIEETQQRIAAAQAETDRLKGLVNDRAAAAYKQAGGGNAFADLDVENAADFETRSKYSSAAADQDKRLMHQLDLAQEELAVQKDEAERIRGEAESEKASLDAARAEAEAATAEIASIKSQVQGELADLLAAERAARDAAAAEEWENQAASPPSGGGGGGGGAPSGPIPGANSGAGGAVSFALSKVGGPYCWGGTGPSCYDCSGLTQAAWAHGGLGIPRTSGAQFSAYPQVPLSAIQPGDLLFRDHGGSGHVAMATGGGMMVHATSSSNNPNAIRHEGISGIAYAVRPG